MDQTLLAGPGGKHSTLCACVCVCLCEGGQMAERLGNRAVNQKVSGSIPSVPMTFCPWARHFTLLDSGGMSLYLV